MSEKKIKIWFFDMCRLSPHSANPKQAELHDVTRQFAGIVKAVDNFHFKRGHKGKLCQLNPITVGGGVLRTRIARRAILDPLKVKIGC